MLYQIADKMIVLLAAHQDFNSLVAKAELLKLNIFGDTALGEPQQIVRWNFVELCKSNDPAV